MNFHVLYAYLKFDFIFKIWLVPRSLESSMLSMEHNMPFKDDLEGFCSELTIPSHNFDHSTHHSFLTNGRTSTRFLHYITASSDLVTRNDICWDFKIIFEGWQVRNNVSLTFTIILTSFVGLCIGFASLVFFNCRGHTLVYNIVNGLEFRFYCIAFDELDK